MTESEYTAVISDIKSAITAGLNEFYPEMNYGTLFKSATDKASLLCCANQGVRALDGVFVTGVEVDENEVIFTIYINERKGQVHLPFEK